MDPIIIDLTSSTSSLALVDKSPSPSPPPKPKPKPKKKSLKKHRNDLYNPPPPSGLAPDQRTFAITPKRTRATVSQMRPASSSFAPISEETEFNFPDLPSELRVMILEALMKDWEREPDKEARICIARLASVHSEWQFVIEKYTMRELRVNLSNAHNLMSMCPRRKRIIRKICLHVALPAYPNCPCLTVETWEDKLENNRVFRDTVLTVFYILSVWEEEEVQPDGIHMEILINSESDMNQCSESEWNYRRWLAKDVGSARYEDSCLDFCGNEFDSPTRLLKIPQVYVISSFETDPTTRRLVFPTAIAEMVEATRRIRHTKLILHKSVACVFASQEPLKSFRLPMLNWATSLESLTLIGQNTNITWRSLPHESMVDIQEFEWLDKPLIKVMGWVKHLHVEDLLRLKRIIGPLWPRDDQPAPFLDHNPLRDHTPFYNLVTFRFQYGALKFPLNWLDTNPDFNSNPDTTDWRQRISLGVARLALYMPKLRLLEVWQRPLMWAGTHRLTYVVEHMGTGPSDPGTAILGWESSFEFRPWDITIEAWEGVAATNAHASDLGVVVKQVQGSRTDGKPPVYTSIGF